MRRWVWWLMAAPALLAADMPGGALVGGSGRLFLLNAKGEITWQRAAGLVHDTWMLPNGNILYADGKACTEVTQDQRVVFEYKTSLKDGPYACQRLPNGNTMVGDNASGKVLEVDAAGKVVFELQTSPMKPGAHHNMRMVRKLASGNYLVCHSSANRVKEYAPDGTVVWEVQTLNLAFAAVRTPAGTTLVSNLDRILEYNKAGEVVWEFSVKDLPGVTVRNMTGMHLLGNGNLAIGCYSAYQGAEGTGLLEITRDRKLVWRYAEPGADKSLMSIQRLDEKGRPLAGPVRR